MKKTTTTWPDTTGALPPGDHPYGVAMWLLGRHPQLADLVDRLPGVTEIEDGRPSVNLDVLATALSEYDAHQAARKETFGWSSPTEDSWARFRAAQPKHSEAAEELMGLSNSALGRLRLLATLSNEGVRFKVSHLRSFDAHGQRLLDDWLDAVRNG